MLSYLLSRRRFAIYRKIFATNDGYEYQMRSWSQRHIGCLSWLVNSLQRARLRLDWVG